MNANADSNKPQEPAVGNTAVEPTPVPQPTLSITSASDLVSKFTKRFPELAGAQPQLKLIAALYANYIQNPVGSVSVKDAIAELDILFKTNIDGVKAAIAAMTRIDADSATNFADQFQERTGRVFNINTLNFANAVDSENTEQHAQDREARGLLVGVQTIVNRLGVADVYNAGLTEVKKPVRGSILVGFLNSAGAKLSKPKPEVQPEAEPAPDWLTEPVLDEKNQKYEELVRFMNLVIGLMDRYAQQPNMRQLVLDYLGNIPEPIKQADIEQKLYEASVFAHKALEQSNEILALVGHDQQHFADWVDSLVDFRHMYGSVAQLFFPK